jgi:hypothetical protein
VRLAILVIIAVSFCEISENFRPFCGLKDRKRYAVFSRDSVNIFEQKNSEKRPLSTMKKIREQLTDPKNAKCVSVASFDKNFNENELINLPQNHPTGTALKVNNRTRGVKTDSERSEKIENTFQSLNIVVIRASSTTKFLILNSNKPSGKNGYIAIWVSYTVQVKKSKRISNKTTAVHFLVQWPQPSLDWRSQ